MEVVPCSQNVYAHSIQTGKGSEKLIIFIHCEGNKGSRWDKFDINKYNYAIPPVRTLQRMSAGSYTIWSGIIRTYLNTFYNMISNGDVLTIFNTDLVKVVPVVESIDAMQVKPGGIDQITKGTVGTIIKLDLEHVVNYSSPEQDELKKILVKTYQSWFLYHWITRWCCQLLSCMRIRHQVLRQSMRTQWPEYTNYKYASGANNLLIMVMILL